MTFMTLIQCTFSPLPSSDQSRIVRLVQRQLQEDLRAHFDLQMGIQSASAGQQILLWIERVRANEKRRRC